MGCTQSTSVATVAEQPPKPLSSTTSGINKTKNTETNHVASSKAEPPSLEQTASLNSVASSTSTATTTLFNSTSPLSSAATHGEMHKDDDEEVTCEENVATSLVDTNPNVDNNIPSAVPETEETMETIDLDDALDLDDGSAVLLVDDDEGWAGDNNSVASAQSFLREMTLEAQLSLVDLVRTESLGNHRFSIVSNVPSTVATTTQEDAEQHL